jgi:hypothetical protein
VFSVKLGVVYDALVLIGVVSVCEAYHLKAGLVTPDALAVRVVLVLLHILVTPSTVILASVASAVDVTVTVLL